MKSETRPAKTKRIWDWENFTPGTLIRSAHRMQLQMIPGQNLDTDTKEMGSESRSVDCGLKKKRGQKDKAL